MQCLKVREVAKRLGLAPSTVHRWLQEGKLRRIKASHKVVYVDPDSLVEVFGEKLIRQAFPELYESKEVD